MITVILIISAVVLGVLGMFGFVLMKFGFDDSEPGQAVAGVLIGLLSFTLAFAQCWVLATLV